MSHSLLILDDYTYSARTFADSSHLVPSRISTLTILNHSIAYEPVDKFLETLQPYTMIHAMRERTPLPRSILSKLPNLKFITTTGMKNRGIDLVAAKESGIVVSGTESVATKGSGGASGTCEQTWALILGLSRRITVEHERLRSGGGGDDDGCWQSENGLATGLYGKTIGIVGLGRLGKQVARVAKAFGMRVQAWSPNLTKQRCDEADEGIEFVETLDKLLETSDVVTIHLVLSESTKGLIGQRQLELMKPTAFLVNTSRGPIVDEVALIDVLKRKGIKGAGLDVFDQEPLPKNHPFRSLDNVVISPHMGYVETPQYEEWWAQTVENVESFLEGKPIRVLN